MEKHVFLVGPKACKINANMLKKEVQKYEKRHVLRPTKINKKVVKKEIKNEALRCEKDM